MAIRRPRVHVMALVVVLGFILSVIALFLSGASTVVVTNGTGQNLARLTVRVCGRALVFEDVGPAQQETRWYRISGDCHFEVEGVLADGTKLGAEGGYVTGGMFLEEANVVVFPDGTSTSSTASPQGHRQRVTALLRRTGFFGARGRPLQSGQRVSPLHEHGSHHTSPVRAVGRPSGRQDAQGTRNLSLQVGQREVIGGLAVRGTVSANGRNNIGKSPRVKRVATQGRRPRLEHLVIPWPYRQVRFGVLC